MAKRDGERRRGLTREDRVLWKTVTKAIKPIRPPRFDEDVDDEPAPQKPRVSVGKPASKPAGKSPPVRETTKPSAPMTPLTRRERQRVSRGRVELDGRFDLHGHTQDEAHAALLRFLRRASGDQAKIVLVITGKSGVLRQRVPQWLNLPEFRGYVIGFEEAGVRHGGEGALYVRVRRARE